MTSFTPPLSPVKGQLRPQLKFHPFALHHSVDLRPWWHFILNVAARESQRRKEFQPAATCAKVQMKKRKRVQRLSADSTVESKLMRFYRRGKSSRRWCAVTKTRRSSRTGTAMLTQCFHAEIAAAPPPHAQHSAAPLCPNPLTFFLFFALSRLPAAEIPPPPPRRLLQTCGSRYTRAAAPSSR